VAAFSGQSSSAQKLPQAGGGLQGGVQEHVLDLDYQNLALVSDPYSGVLKRRPASGHSLIIQERVDDIPALTGEGRQASDTDTGFASDLPKAA
jgi:hypothetical protein